MLRPGFTALLFRFYRSVGLCQLVIGMCALAQFIGTINPLVPLPFSTNKRVSSPPAGGAALRRFP